MVRRETGPAAPESGTAAPWRGVGGVTALAGAIFLAVLVGLLTLPATAVTTVSDVAQGVTALLAGLACLAVRPRAEYRSWAGGWHLIGYGMLAWAAGECVWSYNELVRGISDPLLSLADVGFLAMVPFVLWGVLRLLTLYRGIGLIEALLIATSFFYLSWAWVLGGLYAEAGRPQALVWVVNVAYPVGDVAIASAALILLSSARSADRVTIGLLATGVLAIAVSDSSYAEALSTYRTGHLIDLGWVGGFLLIAVAATLARVTPLSVLTPDDDVTVRGGIWLPYAPLSIAAATSIVLAALGHPPSLVLTVVLVLLFALVLARQTFALRDRQKLATHLRTTVQQLRQQQEILNQLAFSDPLTGLANRALFEESIATPGRPRPARTTAMFVDLDDFKDVNDVQGHDAGDAVLVETARRLRACCRAEDTVARVGGDEFVVIAHDLPDHAVDQMVRRFLTAMRHPVQVQGGRIVVSASIGTATGDAPDLDIHDLIRRADAAMYDAKLTGPGRHSSYVADQTPQESPRRT